MLTQENIAPGITRLRMDDGAVNVMDLERVQAITQVFRDQPEEAFIITGNGRAFSAGVNIMAILMNGPAHVEEFLGALEELLRTVFEHPRPVVSALNGHALAGGALVALASDVRLHSGGVLGITELLVGVPFPPGCIPVTEHACGHRASELIFAGTRMDAQKGFDWGIVQEIFDDEQEMQSRAVEIITELAEIPAEVYALTKTQMRRNAMATWRAEIDSDRQRVYDLWNSAEVQAAMGRYAAKLAAAKKG